MKNKGFARDQSGETSISLESHQGLNEEPQ